MTRCVALAVRVFLLIGLVVIGAPGSSAATTQLEPVTVSPAVGAPRTIFAVHYTADAVDVASDVVEVDGPSGTACAGSLVYGNGGRVDQTAGPVTAYVGPGADERYPAMSETGAYDPVEQGRYSTTPLQRWCPGPYTGQIWYAGDGVAILKGTFQLIVSASGRLAAAPRPPIARHLKHVTVSPSQGAAPTIFAVRFKADAATLGESGDVIEVDGPRRSSCVGGLVRGVAFRNNFGAGLLTLHIGPGAARTHPDRTGISAYDPLSPTGSQAPLRRWCAGTYTGRIWFENYASLVLEARFQLTVA